MKHFRSSKNAILFTAVVILFAITSPALAANLEQANLVKNASFEGGTYVADSVGNMRVPNDWEAFQLGSSTMHYEAEQHPSHVHSGTWSARYFTAWQNHNAGLRQKVTGLTPGATYRLTGNVFLWSTDTPVVDTPSTSFMTAYLGADPTGGKDPASANVKWTSYREMDRFLALSVDVVPAGTEMWIFLRSKTEWPVDRNDAFWDSISLVQVAGSTAVAPTTAPGQPTTSAGTPVPGVRSTPDSQGRIIHTVVSGDTLSGIAYLYGVTMDQIRQLNGMSNDIVLLGTQLIISNGTVVPTAAPPTTTTEAPADAATPEPTATVAAQAALPGKLCVISFVDENGNGFREPDEKGAASVSFSLSEGAQMLTSKTTDAAGSLCFDALEPATYTISWAGAEYQPTTDQSWTANLTEGVTLNHEFGMQSVLAAGDEETNDKTPRDGLPGWVIALIGSLGAVLLLAGLGAGGYFLLMKRTKV